jgi:hypothetical protein
VSFLPRRALNFAISYYGADIEDKIQVIQNLIVSWELRYDLLIPTDSPSRYERGRLLASTPVRPDIDLSDTLGQKYAFSPIV